MLQWAFLRTSTHLTLYGHFSEFVWHYTKTVTLLLDADGTPTSFPGSIFSPLPTPSPERGWEKEITWKIGLWNA